MGAPYDRARKPGSGCIQRQWLHYIARAPKLRHERHGAIIGKFDTRREATRALEAWLEQRKGAA